MGEASFRALANGINPMSDIRDVLHVAARRLHLTAFIDRLHIVAVMIAAIALLAVLFGKMTPALAIPWIWAGPGMAVVAVVAATLLWLSRRMNDLQVAVAVDERLDLREKLSTALHVSGRDDAFARAAVEDAVAVARDGRTQESVRRKFPVESPNRWWLAPGLVAVALLIGFLVPQGDLFAKSPEPEVQQQPIPTVVTASLNAAVEQIQENAELAEELKDVFEDLDPKAIDPDALKSPESAKREAIKKLSDLSDRLEELMEGEKGKTMEALEKALGDMKTPTEDGAAREMMEAMKKGDFKAAQDALQKLQQEIAQGDMAPEQAEKIAQQLQQMAQQMQQLAQQQKALEDALKEAGLDPALAQNPQQLQQQLQQNQNLTQQQKQQLQQMAQAQQQACQMCQGMANAMGQMAQGMGQGGQNGQQMQQAMQNAQQMLGDMEAMQQMLKQAQAMCNGLKGQCQGLGQGLGQGQGQGGAFGGQGQGAGGEAPKSATPTRSQLEKADSRGNDADVISSLPFDGPIITGESTAAFKEAALSNARSWAENVNDDQIPRKYKEAMQHYFGEKMKEYGGAQGGGASGESGESNGSSGDQSGE